MSRPWLPTHLIATDEAGYGPTLGPLVIAATAWELPTPESKDDHDVDLAKLFHRFQQPFVFDRASYAINDSKAVYKPKPCQQATPLTLRWQDFQSQPIAKTVAALSHLAAHTQSSTRIADWLQEIAPDDADDLRETPWLCESVSDNSVLAHCQDSVVEMLQDTWTLSNNEPHPKLTSIASRIVTARRFNQWYDTGRNKSDLLSETTIALVRRVAVSIPTEHSSHSCCIDVFCDRHGGRKRYAGVLQHVFHEHPIEVCTESKHLSIYQIKIENTSLRFHFTVKGDRFTPVAAASHFAKFQRELLMMVFNEYFRRASKKDKAPKPTAGYPVDASRFLEDIDPIFDILKIKRNDLVRQA
ncbi:MAG: hypothetical protein AAF664_13920 [Planctomycetota bacterium]